jgi:hypothetical protein
MAIKSAKYYSGDDQTPNMPQAGGDYGGPTPHSRVANQSPFHAQSTRAPGDDSTGEGVGSVTANDYFFGNPTTVASYTPTTGSGSDIASDAGQAAANDAFNAPAHGIQPQYPPID